MKKSSLNIMYVNVRDGEKIYKIKEGYTFTAMTSDDHTVDLFVFKEDNGTWNATEPQSTATVGTGATRKEAVSLAQSRIGARPLEEFNRAVGRVSEYKNNIDK